jgi:nitroimidazol reductase NimA-like FMN-containing flavoprotein (pyridoxamine 5'-phosphate oxidase superfamily)
MREMRRQDRKIEYKEAYQILKDGEYGILSMVTTDNSAYGIPFSYVIIDDSVYFHCALEGSKLDFIRKNNKVSFCVVGKTEVLPSKFSTKYESAIVLGEIYEVNDQNEKKKSLIELVVKYSPAHMESGEKYIDAALHQVNILRLDIKELTGKARKNG